MKSQPRSLYSQRGATLVIALIILMVMSMIGISNMQSSTMQERMAGNNRQKSVAQNSAESALRVAESWLASEVTRTADLSKFNGSSGLFSAVNRPNGGAAAPLSANVADVTDPDNWSGKGVAQDTSSADIVDEDLVSQQPRYVIEYLGRDLRGSANKVVTTLDAEAKGEGDTSPHLFRVTAIGWGRDNNIYTVLEATYRTGYGSGKFTY